jgi:hypothetical protein
VGETDVDAGFAEFSRLKEQSAAICKVLVDIPPSRVSSPATEGPHFASMSPVEDDTSRRGIASEAARRFTKRLSLGSVSERDAEIILEEPRKMSETNAIWIAAVRDWRTCLEDLADAHAAWLGNTYKQVQHLATPEMLDLISKDPKAKAQVMSQFTKSPAQSRSSKTQSEMVSCLPLPF